MKKRNLSDDEKELWQEFSKTTVPLIHQSQSIQKAKPEEKKRVNSVNLLNPEEYFAGRAITPSLVKRDPAYPTLNMDFKLHNKLKQGKMRPEAKLDLHGLNLVQAQPILTKFVLNAHSRGLRLILIITGKGKNSEDNNVIPRRKGILKAAVPNWLAMEPLSSKILQTTNAHVKHGGGGAFYIYLRKKGK
jgi:DNA-nicking Smr family endonuclease